MLDLSKTYLFRMIHIANIPHILQYGITHITSGESNNNYVPIGDTTIISNRNTFYLPNGNSLGQYIPFYFGVRMPMLYVIQKGFNNVKPTNSEDIVYCICTVQKIIDCGLPFLFADGHAIDGLTSFYDETHIQLIDNIIDKNAVNAKFWNKEDDLDLKRRKEAEFLIGSDLPLTAIAGWCVFNQPAKTMLLKMGIADNQIMIKPDFYF